jgi:hypothetical protein
LLERIKTAMWQFEAIVVFCKNGSQDHFPVQERKGVRALFALSQQQTIQYLTTTAGASLIEKLRCGPLLNGLL